MKALKRVAYAVLAASAVASLVFVHALQPTSAGAAVFFAVWLLLPYGLLALMLVMTREMASARAAAVAAIAVAAAGVLFVVYVVYLNPDPQGGIAVFLTPVYQAIGVAVLLPLCRWLMRAR